MVVATRRLALGRPLLSLLQPIQCFDDPRVEEDEPDDDDPVMRSAGPRPSEDTGPEPRQRAGAGPHEVHLTEREREVLSYLALGWETRHIAEELGVSPYTARNHIENLRVKPGRVEPSGGRHGRHAARNSAVRIIPGFRRVPISSGGGVPVQSGPQRA